MADTGFVEESKAGSAVRYCRVCGYDDPDLPWGEDGKIPSFFICPCCGAEHGYQDCTPEATARYRERWLVQGSPWADRHVPHDGLEPLDRLARILTPPLGD